MSRTAISSGGVTQLWLCLLLPRLGLELFTRSLADGASARPVVLVEAHRVVQLNAAARARGLQVGMSLATAEGICADLGVAERAPEREAAALRRLAVWAYRFTPRVTPEPPDALLLEVSGSLRLFRGLDRLQRRVLAGIEALGYSGLAGVAPTPLAARALTRAGRAADPEQLAAELRVAGGGEAPLREAWSRAVRHASRPALAGLPLAYLDRPERDLERLEAMGLRTVGRLLKLPRAALAKRFGAELLEHLDKLTGRRADPREPIVPPPTFASTVHFLEDVTDAAALAFPMRRLVDELTEWLRLRQLATDRLAWRLLHPRHGEQRLRVRLATPEREPKRLLELSRLQLEREAGLPAVGSLALEVTRLARHAGAAETLFPAHASATGAPGGRGEPPGMLVDRIRARLGEAVCRSLRPADDHRPEHAWRSAAPQPERSRPTRPPASPEPPAGPRPLWLLEPPQPLAVRDGMPCWHGPLTLGRGPERIETGWWDGASEPPAARDYWVARHASGAHYWVFRERVEGRWFLHGIFG